MLSVFLITKDGESVIQYFRFKRKEKKMIQSLKKITATRVGSFTKIRTSSSFRIYLVGKAIKIPLK